MVDLAKVMGLDIPAAAGATVVAKASDETVNDSEVLQNDDDLVLAVGANEIWLIEVMLRINTQSSITPDMDYAFVVPGGGTIESFVTISITNAQTFVDMTGETFTQVLVTTPTYLHFWLLYIGAGSAGNLQLQWAQNVATAEDTKMLKGSFMICHQLV